MGKIDLTKTTERKQNNEERLNYFKLSGDGDSAEVQFCYEKPTDIETLTIHQVTDKSGKQRKVYCSREYNDPIDNCPFCKAKYGDKENTKYPNIGARRTLSYIFVKNITTGQKEVWEKPKSFVEEKILGFGKHYTPLSNFLFAIERNGAKGAKTTTYGVYPIPGTPTPLTVDELNNPSVVGKCVASRNAEQMEYFIQNGEFKPYNRPASVESQPFPTDKDAPIDTTFANEDVILRQRF